MAAMGLIDQVIQLVNKLDEDRQSDEQLRVPAQFFVQDPVATDFGECIRSIHALEIGIPALNVAPDFVDFVDQLNRTILEFVRDNREFLGECQFHSASLWPSIRTLTAQVAIMSEQEPIETDSSQIVDELTETMRDLVKPSDTLKSNADTVRAQIYEVAKLKKELAMAERERTLFETQEAEYRKYLADAGVHLPTVDEFMAQFDLP
jgi:hypothetical protein